MDAGLPCAQPFPTKNDRQHPIAAIKQGLHSQHRMISAEFVGLLADVLVLLGIGERTRYSALVLTDRIRVLLSPIILCT